MDAAVHPTLLKEGGGTVTTMLPPTPLAGMEEESAAAATTLVRLIGIVPEALGESWNVAVATTPLLIAVVFTPKMMQVLPPQDRLFPAFVAAGPNTTVTPVIPEG
jgi:hypothetical protein